MQKENSKKPRNIATYIVYDRETGEILHIHQAVALPGVEFPGENKLKASAMDLGSRMTGRSVQQMEVISVREEEMKIGTQYKVNLQNKRLVAKDQVE